jgi:hypothetical protein
VSSPLLPFAKAAVDVRVTNSFSSQSVGDSSYTVPITKHLQKAEQAKFHGPSVSTTTITFVNGETYHSWFPTNWIQQTLGANINLTFTQHLYRSIHKNYTPRL